VIEIARIDVGGNAAVGGKVGKMEVRGIGMRGLETAGSEVGGLEIGVGVGIACRQATNPVLATVNS
jgi:hypothetical protein